MQAESLPLTFLCLASYDKGQRFLEELKRQGCRVILLTSESLKETAPWPRDCLEDIFYVPDADHEWNIQQMLLGVCHLCRTVSLDRVVPLDDLDLEKAAILREHLRLPGLGETATRFFRDKLAMRQRALESQIRVPAFCATFNYQVITASWTPFPRLGS